MLFVCALLLLITFSRRVESARRYEYHVVVVSDGHTVSDRPHLDAATVIQHHHWVWGNLITNRSVRILRTNQLIDESAA